MVVQARLAVSAVPAAGGERQKRPGEADGAICVADGDLGLKVEVRNRVKVKGGVEGDLGSGVEVRNGGRLRVGSRVLLSPQYLAACRPPYMVRVAGYMRRMHAEGEG